MDSFFFVHLHTPFFIAKKKAATATIDNNWGEWGQRGPNNKERDIIILHYIIHREVES